MFDEVVASNQQGERKDWSTNLFFLLEPGHHPIRRLERLNLTFNLNIRHYLFINIYLINNRMLQILQRYHAESWVDGPPQVTVASSFLINEVTWS